MLMGIKMSKNKNKTSTTTNNLAFLKNTVEQVHGLYNLLAL